MSDLLIKNAAMVLPDRTLPKHSVLCKDGKIARVGPDKDLQGESAERVIEASGQYLAPGFIDLHTHGLHHHLIYRGPEDLAAVCMLLPRYGVTGFLPTLRPLPEGQDAAFAASLAKVQSQGTQILAFHFEGPFITLTGALPPEALEKKSHPGRVKALIEASKPYRAIFSVAPDFEGILDLIPIMSENNTAVFMTHTAASVGQTQAAIEAGVRHATHVYDVFPAPDETEPGSRPCGVVEAILADPQVSVDFILDGVHVDPIAVKAALQCKGPDKVCLITDANVGAGLPPGVYPGFGGIELEFTYPGGPARMTEKSHKPGTLSGSGLTLDLAVRNAVRMLGVDVPLAVRMASTNPAGVLGLGDRKGQIKQGYDADMVLLDDHLGAVRTWIGGRCRFEKSGRPE